MTSRPWDGDRPWPIILTLAAISAVVLIVMNPWLLLSATTPTGGDMGAHVLGPAFLRDHLLPEGRLIGWSQDWYAGFPAFYFYFPLPSLTIVALDLVMPYGVAFKVVTVLGLLATPPAAYYLARSLTLGRHVSLVAAGSGVVFAFYESYSIYGGNVASTLAGEFSYSWSFAFSLVYLGLLTRAVRDDRKYLKWAALALALTALCHVLTTIVIVFASLFLLPWRKALPITLVTWAWGFAIAAIWALPLLVRIGYSSDMAWTPLSRWEEIFPIEIWLALPVAVAGAVWLSRRTRRAAPVVAATLLPLIYFPLPNLLPELLPSFFPEERWKLWNGRLLPYWYFGVAFLAAVGVGAAVVWLARRLPARLSAHWPRALIALITVVACGLIVRSDEFPTWAWIPVAIAGALLIGVSFQWVETVGTRNFLVGTAASVIVLGSLSSVSFIDGWSRWNYEGYEAKDPWPEYQALMMEIDALPPGRVHWEANSELNRYGTPMSPMLIPYWTEGSHPSMEGLYFESSLTTPFHFINSSEMSERPSNPIPGLRYHTGNIDRGLRHLELFGVSYYVSFTEEATERADARAELVRLESTGPFTIYRLPETPLVEPATHLPAVYEGGGGGLLASVFGSTEEARPEFHDFALEWYDDVDNLHRWVVADGPADWPRIGELGERPDLALDVPPGAVSDVVVEHHRISFRTEAVGHPHLIKVSYFPNWTAEGAEGPWRAAPSLMVVVPTQEEVTLEFADTWAETGGKVLSLLGIIGLAGVVVRDRFGSSSG